MWMKELENGKYKFTERYQFEDMDKPKYVSVTLKSKSKQAENQATRMLMKKIEDKRNEKKKKELMTVSELFDRWLKIKSKSIKQSSYKDYKNRADQIIKIIGEVDINKLTAGQCNQMFEDWLIDDDLKYKTVHERYKILKSALEYGLRNDYIEKSIIESLKVEKINMSEFREDKYLEKEEADIVFKHIKNEDYLFVFKLMHHLGMRYYEAAAIHLEQIDFDELQITIDKQYDHNHKIYTLPKNNKVRTNHFNATTLKLIKNQLKRRKELMMLYGVRDCNLLAFNSRGEPLDISYANKLLDRVPLEKKITTHIFRHTFATRMVENNIPAKLIAEHLGQATTEMVDRIYAHFSQKMNDDLRDAINTVAI